LSSDLLKPCPASQIILDREECEIIEDQVRFRHVLRWPLLARERDTLHAGACGRLDAGGRVFKGQALLRSHPQALGRHDVSGGMRFSGRIVLATQDHADIRREAHHRHAVFNIGDVGAGDDADGVVFGQPFE